MKREIKFKGKRVDNGEWVEGYLSSVDEITVFEYDGSVGLATSESYEVIPETVGQFTGLKDKNGVDIFEGDIVVADCAPSGSSKRSIKNHKCVIEFGELHHGWNCLIIDHENGVKWTTGYMSWGRNGNSLEVISNIHDNPELL